MRIGLISDTHGLLRPEVFAAFEGVDHIIHAGDVGDADILVELAAVAPITAVRGNVDGWPLSGSLPEVARLEVEGVAIEVVHGQQYGTPTATRIAAEHPDADLIVFGHSHRPEIHRSGSTLVVNPGSAGPRRSNLPITVAVATITGGEVSAQLVRLIDPEATASAYSAQ